MAKQRRRVSARAPVLLLLLMLLPGIGFGADPLFAPPRYVSVPGEQVFDLAASDFDADGWLDLACVSYECDSLSILRGGISGFLPPRSYWAGDGPSSLIYADLNGDLHGDIATVAWDDSLRVFFGLGDAGFEAGPVYATAGNPWELACGDLDGDQDIDLVCSHTEDPVFMVFLNDGNGHFAAAEHATSDRQRGLVVAEMDGIGGPDIVLAVFAGDQLAVHLNNGAGGFMPAISYTTADKPYDLEAVDIDLNGIDDLLLIHKDALHQIWGIPGLGMGYLGPPIVWNADHEMDQALLADFDDDQDLDLLVTSSASNNVGVLLQPNDGNWEDPFFQEGGFGAYACAAGDFDEDGDLDVIVSSYWTAQLALLDNRTYYVPVSVGDFGASTSPGRVDLEWEAFTGGGQARFRVQATGPADDFERGLTPVDDLNGRWRAVDRDAALWSGGMVTYRLYGRGDGEAWQEQRVLRVTLPAASPGAPRLLPPWPNPANPSVRLGFLLPEAGRAELSIHDLRGRRLAKLRSGHSDAGRHEFIWEGRDDAGHELPSGVYLVNLRAAGVGESRRIVLLR